jgi:putative cardiolipin synthase
MLHITLVIWLAVAFVLLSALSALGVYLYGRYAYRRRAEPSSALAAGEGGELDRLLAPLTAARPGQSGLQLIAESPQAFAIRALSARTAVRSLDLLYYYWKEDMTGTLLAGEVLAAADRGVRVRLLVDDINLRGRDANWLSLDSHPNIEVRVFNPCINRVGYLQRGLELALRLWSTTRRMHNKAWIADGRLAIVGGRNIGDPYFDAADLFNFRDLDLAIIGPAVDDTAAVFDRYWNSDCVLAIRSLPRIETGDLAGLRRDIASMQTSQAAVPFLERVRNEPSVRTMLEEDPRFHWCEKVEIVADPPGKSMGADRGNWLYKSIFPIALGAQRSLGIISPYFIPGDQGVRDLTALARRGVHVTVLTNSLAATDVAAVHGAYARYRPPLIAAGVRLHELRPRARRGNISLFGSRGASLHTKAFVVDGRAGFVGSFNFDPRSVNLNTEMGVLFENAELAGEVNGHFAVLTSSAASWRLGRRRGRLVWHDGAGDTAPVHTREPAAGFMRRVVARLVRWLPIESQL